MRRVTSSSVLALIGLLAVGSMPTLASDPAPSGVPGASGPAGSSAEPSAPLEGTTWLLTNARLSGAYAAIPPEVTATLILDGGQAGGSGGCNQWSAPYVLDGDQLTFGVVTSTLMLCAGAGGTVETFYFADLGSVASWAIEGATLTLSADDGQPVLAFAALAAPSLVGSWTVTSYADGSGALVSVDDGSVAVVFEASSVSGTAGCNGFRGTWSLTGDTLAISPLMSTKMACDPAELMAREAAVMADLEASTSIRGEAGGGITLLDAAGAVRLTLAPLTMASSSPAGAAT